MNTVSMEGGVILTAVWKDRSPEEALFYFLANSKSCKLLTDSSISCFTYVFTLGDRVVSPYVTVRSVNLNEPVTQILLKVGLLSFTSEITYYQGDQVKRTNFVRPDFECGTEMSIKKEADIQNDVFRKSFFSSESPFEPICPAIISYASKISLQNKRRIYNNLTKILTVRSSRRTYTDLQATESLFSKPNAITLIVMEFMTGYEVLGDYSSDRRWNNFNNMHRYELTRLKNIGYIS